MFSHLQDEIHSQQQQSSMDTQKSDGKIKNKSCALNCALCYEWEWCNLLKLMLVWISNIEYL